MANFLFFAFSALSLVIVISKSLPFKRLAQDEKNTKVNSSNLNDSLRSLQTFSTKGFFVTEHQHIDSSDGKGITYPPLKNNLPGNYTSLSDLTASLGFPIGIDMESCPSSLSIMKVAPVLQEGPGVFAIDYNSGLRVDGEDCFSITDAATELKLYPTTIPIAPGNAEKIQVWLGLIPENSLRCGPEPAPQISVSVIQSEAMLKSLQLPHPMAMENAMSINSSFAIVVTLDNSVCPYFTESDMSMVEALIQKAVMSNSGVIPDKSGEHTKQPATEMDPESILFSHFELRQLCPCSPHFPKVVSFLPASFHEDGSEAEIDNGNEPERQVKPQGLEEEHDDAAHDEPTEMPMPIKWNGNFCPTKDIYTIGEVVSFDEKAHINDPVKRLMLHGVVEKLFDEMRDEIMSDSSATVSFGKKKAFLQELGEGLEGMRGVIPFRHGSKCGIQNITEDFVLLLEIYHILHQLYNKPIKRAIEEAKWQEILDSEKESTKSGTLHVFAFQEPGDLDVCTYTASPRTIALFAGNCDSFVPLGKGNLVRTPTDGNDTRPSPEPTKQYPISGNDTVQEDRNTAHSTSDKNNSSTLSLLPTSEAGREGSNPELEQPDSEGATQTMTPSAIPSAKPTITPSASLVASPMTSPTVTPSPTAKPSPSPSPSVSSNRLNSSISPTPSPNSFSISPSPNTTETDDSESACFPAAAKVILADGSYVTMKRLQTGDHVFDGRGEISRVLTFAHANPTVESVFVLVKYEGGELPISSQHYLPINGKLATADSVRVGDSISVMTTEKEIGMSAFVTGVERISLTGLYNPQTASGSIAVVWKGSAVVTSTYTKAVNPATAHLMMLPLRWLDQVAGIVVPVVAHVLRDGSVFWKRLLPQGSTML
ncbi:unnamed protein product [Agarophyton chilense]